MVELFSSKNGSFWYRIIIHSGKPMHIYTGSKEGELNPYDNSFTGYYVGSIVKNKKQFEEYLSSVKTYNKWDDDSVKVFYIHQKDDRPFNRGGIKNIGFFIIRRMYPETYKNMTFEFNCAIDNINDKGIIISDDILDNDAYYDFIKDKKIKNSIIKVENRGLGFIQKD